MMDKVHKTNNLQRDIPLSKPYRKTCLYMHSSFFRVFKHLRILPADIRIRFSTVSSVTIQKVYPVLCSPDLIFINCTFHFFPIFPFLTWFNCVQPSATFEYLISTNSAKTNKSYYIFSNLYTNYKCRFHYFEYLPGLDFHLRLLQA